MTLPGFHVNSDKPTGQYIIPLTLKWEDAPLKAESVKYPKAEVLKVGTETLSVFTGNFTIESEFQAPAGAKSGPATIEGKIHYQACNAQMCFRPSTTTVHVPVIVE